MPGESEFSVLAQAEEVAHSYELRWRHAMSQLEAHDFRIKNSPITERVPSIVETDQGTVMRIPIKQNVSGAQIADLIEGIEISVELISEE